MRVDRMSLPLEDVVQPLGVDLPPREYERGAQLLVSSVSRQLRLFSCLTR